MAPLEAPVGSHYPQLGKRTFQRHRLAEGLRHGHVLGQEVGITALVIQLGIHTILYGNAGKIGRIVVQVGRLALAHKVGPGYKLVGIVGRQSEVEGNRSVGIDRLQLRLSEQRRTVFGVNGYLITQVILTPVYIHQSPLTTVSPRYGTRNL